MTPVRRYGSISVSFSVIYHYNNYCRGTGGTCNAVIQFNSLTLTMDVECRQKLMSISGFFCPPLVVTDSSVGRSSGLLLCLIMYGC